MAESTPAFEVVPLEKGVTLHHRRSDRFKTEYVRVFLRAPLDAYQAERQLFAAMMGRGTRARPSRRELAAHLHHLWGAGYGISVHRMQDRQVFALKASTISGRWLPGRPDNLRELLAFLGEGLDGPARDANDRLDEEVFEQERRQLLVDLAGRRNNKSRWAMIRLREELFGADHPLVRPMHGTQEEIEAATQENAIALGMDTMLHGEADVFVVGPCTTKQAEKLVRKHLGLGERKKERHRKVEMPTMRKRVRSVRETDAVEQGRLVMGFRHPNWTGKEDRTLCAIADTVLGGTFGSKLFKNVREKHSLCYEISSQFDPGHGVLFVSLGIESPNRDAAIKAVKKEVRDLCEGRLEADEVEMAKLTMLSAIEGVVDSPTGMIEFFYQRHLQKRREQSLDAIARRIARTDMGRVPDLLGDLRLDTVFFLDREDAGARRAAS